MADTTPLLASDAGTSIIGEDSVSATLSLDVSSLTIGIPKEHTSNEKRCAVVPASVAKLVNAGFKVIAAHGVGEGSGFDDKMYQEAGAAVVTNKEAFGANIVMKISAPDNSEIALMRKGAVLFSLVYPVINPDKVLKLASKDLTVFALDCIPRTISRAQAFDVLSSQANISGYRAVIEAAAIFKRFFAAQFTMAGRIDAAKVLVVGAGVAGLAAIQTAKNMGAVVRAFDVRAAAREQVESFGAEFLQVRFPPSPPPFSGGGSVLFPASPLTTECKEETEARSSTLEDQPRAFGSCHEICSSLTGSPTPDWAHGPSE
mmetsp:Transcript_22459/g.53723  ORF Transcript_22459/g.53723 Transcript_22459/m.53723 type:complete len:316 (+) Transcript_22459:139-1086(+)